MKRNCQVFIGLSLALGLSACSSPAQPESLEKDTSYQAKLDYESNLILKPLTEYLPSRKQINTYNTAHSILLNTCLQREGYFYPRYQPDSTLEGSREYGMWNPEYTQKYGFGLTSDYVQKNQNENEQLNNVPPEKIQSCYEQNKSILDEIAPEDTSNQGSAAIRISNEARQAAIADPDWNKAKEEWWACLSEQGLTPQKGSDKWGSEEEEKIAREVDQTKDTVQKENIRIATIYAECSKKTGMAQKLANLEAAFQGPLIKENQSVLNSEKEKLASKNKKAEEIVAKSQ